MKKYFSRVAFLVICLGGINAVAGQDKPDASREFSELQSKSYELRKSKSIRSKTTTEVFDASGKKLKYRIVSVSETAPPGRYRYVSTKTSDGETVKFESITVGGKTYFKEGDGKWELDESKPKYGVAIASLSGIRLVEETTLGGQPVKVYEEKNSRSSETGGYIDATAKYWFTLAGELLKVETEERGEKEGEITRIVALYEYDPNIKIEAPIK